MIDQRIVKLTIDLADGSSFSYQNLAITINGEYFYNPISAPAIITVANLDADTRNKIVTLASPTFNPSNTNNFATLEVGRESTGSSLLFRGRIFWSSVSQAPDNVLTIQCFAGGELKGLMSTVSLHNVNLSQIAKRLADRIGKRLVFTAPDYTISNYSYSGNRYDELNYFYKIVNNNANSVNIRVYIDNESLYVKTAGEFSNTLDISEDSGLVGIPQLTQFGAVISFLYTRNVSVATRIRLTSKQYPYMNGDYQIYSLQYNITNRDVPFYFIAQTQRLMN